MFNQVEVEIKFIDHSLEATYGAPVYMTQGAAAVDLRACMHEPFMLSAGKSHAFHAGFAMHIQTNAVAAMIIPRSGLGFKRKITLTNGTGLIDSDYQGEILVSLRNDGADYIIQPYERIAQMIFAPVMRAVWSKVKKFNESERGEGGFGSTGID